MRIPQLAFANSGAPAIESIAAPSARRLPKEIGAAPVIAEPPGGRQADVATRIVTARASGAVDRICSPRVLSERYSVQRPIGSCAAYALAARRAAWSRSAASLTLKNRRAGSPARRTSSIAT